VVKIGIIGMGIRGTLFADTILKNPYAELVAVSDSYESTLKRSVDKYGVKGYSASEEMIEQADLDAIVIATPDFLHKLPLILAAKKGLHIMIEKPFTTNVEEAEEMNLAVKEANVKCLVAFENRWNIPFVAVKESVQNGEIGKIVTVNSRLNDTIYVPTKMLSWSKGSTPAWFLFPHIIDMSCWLKGSKVTKVYAVGTKKKLVSMGIDTYDSIQAVVTYDDDTHATFTTSWILPDAMPTIYDMKFEIIGENGALYVDLADQMVRKAVTDYKHMHTLGTPINGVLTAAPSLMLNSFIDNVRLGTEPTATVDDGLHNTKVIYAIHKSLETGTVQFV
jgi:predicted dehydrogenase